jgi:transcriptional regulator GlxA family with amidase domain
MDRHVIALAVADALPIFELAVPCEVFGIDRSDIVDPWYDFRLCAVQDGPLRTAAGLSIDTPYGIEELATADTVLVPASDRGMIHNPPPHLLDALRAAHERGARIASICNGAYILAAAGLLDGRPATTHWMNRADFAERFPRVDLHADVLYTDDGDILTSAGTGAAIDLCLHLVRRDHGAAVANTVARRMVVPPHREGGQAQYIESPVPPRVDQTLAPVLDWARGRLGEPLTVADLAARAGVSSRTFARRFNAATGTSPLRWLLRERIRFAQHLLEATDQSVEAVAERAGFGSSANLRGHFGRVVGVPPNGYRKLFASARGEVGSGGGAR